MGHRHPAPRNSTPHPTKNKPQKRIAANCSQEGLSTTKNGSVYSKTDFPRTKTPISLDFTNNRISSLDRDKAVIIRPDTGKPGRQLRQRSYPGSPMRDSKSISYPFHLTTQQYTGTRRIRKNVPKHITLAAFRKVKKFKETKST